MKPFTLGGIRWWAGRGQDADALRPVVAAALAALAAGSAANQKRGRRKALYPLALGAGDRTTHLLKVNSYGARDGLRRRVVASKARRELALAEAVAARGIATPVPIAAGEARSGGRVRACYLLVPFVTGAVDLRRRAAEPLPPAERRALATSFGRFARAIHAAGISQDDFQPNNFLVGPAGSGDLRLIDCERLALRARVADDTAAWQLAKLEREMPAASLADRARFVAAYAGDASRAGRSARRAIWRRVQAAQPELARHDAERIRRAIRAGGRRFAPLELAGWRGVRAEGAWRDALAPELARALETPPPPGVLAAALARPSSSSRHRAARRSAPSRPRSGGRFGPRSWRCSAASSRSDGSRRRPLRTWGARSGVHRSRSRSSRRRASSPTGAPPMPRGPPHARSPPASPSPARIAAPKQRRAERR